MPTLEGTLENQDRKRKHPNYHPRHRPSGGNDTQNLSEWAQYHLTEFSIYKRDSTEILIGTAGA